MKQSILTERAPKPVGPYSQGIRVPGLIFVSGQIARDPKTGTYLGGDARQQTQHIMEHIQNILEAAGANLDSVVKTTVFLKDMNDYDAMNEIYGTYFRNTPPARSIIQVARLPGDALVEVEVTACN